MTPAEAHDTSNRATDPRNTPPALDHGAHHGLYRRLSRHDQAGLHGAGINRLQALERSEPPRSYEHEHRDHLLHLNINKLVRFQQLRRLGHHITGVRAKDSIGTGLQFVHLDIDERSRIDFSEIVTGVGQPDAIARLRTLRTL